MSGGLSETLKAISTPRVQPRELHRDRQRSPRMVTVLRATPGTGGSLALQSQTWGLALHPDSSPYFLVLQRPRLRSWGEL